MEAGSVSEARKGQEVVYRFLIVVEKANGDFSAYSPDLPGCVATGKTRDQVTKKMYKAIEMHVHGLVEDKLCLCRSHALSLSTWPSRRAGERYSRVGWAIDSRITNVSSPPSFQWLGAGLFKRPLYDISYAWLDSRQAVSWHWRLTA
jgi:predicted RNase H-like HicB family nuclease